MKMKREMSKGEIKNIKSVTLSKTYKLDLSGMNDYEKIPILNCGEDKLPTFVATCAIHGRPIKRSVGPGQSLLVMF